MSIRWEVMMCDNMGQRKERVSCSSCATRPCKCWSFGSFEFHAVAGTRGLQSQKRRQKKPLLFVTSRWSAANTGQMTLRSTETSRWRWSRQSCCRSTSSGPSLWKRYSVWPLETVKTSCNSQPGGFSAQNLWSSRPLIWSITLFAHKHTGSSWRELWEVCWDFIFIYYVGLLVDINAGLSQLSISWHDTWPFATYICWD